MFPRTERMKVLVKYMRQHRLESLEASLCQAVREEMLALREMRNNASRSRGGADDPVLSGAAAEDVYVTQILEWMGGGTREESLSPEDVLYYRCKAASWAIARLLVDSLGEMGTEELVGALMETP